MAHTDKLDAPEGITLQLEGRQLTVRGQKGEAKRKFIEPSVKLSVEGNSVVFKAPVFTMREKALIGTYKAHIRNMFRGVTEGHHYELKVCSGHFPMNVECKGGVFQVKNYLGEKIPRKLKIDSGAEVRVEGDKVTIEGVEKETVAQTAARIEQLTRRSRFDRRIFQDGIYIVNKDGKEIK